MKKQAPVPSIEEFLLDYPPAWGPVVGRLRALIREVVPEVQEAVVPGWKLIGYRAHAPVSSEALELTGAASKSARASSKGSRGRYFCFVAPQASIVRLGFEHGILMRDPHGVLTGTGTQVRQVDFTGLQSPEISDAVLKEVILEGLQVSLSLVGVRRVGKQARE